MIFADTNWLEALYFESPNPEQQLREATVQRFMRKQGGQLAISHVVYLEVRNVFSRISGEAEPEEWRRFVADFNGLIYLDPMNWDFVRRDAFALFAKYAHRTTLGTLDVAIVASAKLSGATQLLSFDRVLKAVAVAEELLIFPPLDAEGRGLLAKLRERSR
ncbi:MAG TPA: type II toxin-antitoxin system VapC family toxin [Verrucomicrobiae bacterium]|jgi:predicted nucleic acid-binding protein|nr:type II toxin-antitoxin system VapC family toxin [Verrucomicrobiae bacterium]